MKTSTPKTDTLILMPPFFPVAPNWNSPNNHQWVNG